MIKTLYEQFKPASLHIGATNPYLHDSNTPMPFFKIMIIDLPCGIHFTTFKTPLNSIILFLFGSGSCFAGKWRRDGRPGFSGCGGGCPLESRASTSATRHADRHPTRWAWHIGYSVFHMLATACGVCQSIIMCVYGLRCGWNFLSSNNSNHFATSLKIVEKIGHLLFHI